jgi:hypothetical protein
MTLKDIIDSRGSRFDRDIQERVPMAEFWQGYQHGWKMAYQDLREILDQNGFDKNIIVINDDIYDRQN